MIPEGDHAGRERLLRYLARAPVSLERMSLMPDGRIAYELRHAWRAGRTHVLLEPMQLLARLAALVPSPRHPLLRFHGAFAPNSTWREHVVPLTPPRLAGVKQACEPAPNRAHEHAKGEQEAAKQESTRPAGTPPTAARTDPTREREPTGEETPTARSRWYIDWATLLRRVYDVNALACFCGGKLRFIELVDNERDARSFLATHGAKFGVSSDRDPDADPTVRAALRADAALGLDEEPDYDAAGPSPDYYAVDPPPDCSDCSDSS
jgi:Putative transposase